MQERTCARLKIVLKNIMNRAGLFRIQTMAVWQTVAVHAPYELNHGSAVQFVERNEPWGLGPVGYVSEPNRMVRGSKRAQH